MQVPRARFEKLVEEAIDEIPEKFQDAINNLVFFVEDHPTAGQLKKTGILKGGNFILFGLYEGYHQSKRLNIGPVLPDRITLFKKAIESVCNTEEELKRQISKTVRHEIAHHFGSDEKGASKVG